MKNGNLWKSDRLLICGHRGQVAGGHENTMTAFQKAIEENVDFIETDVHMTKDGQIVLNHDSLIQPAGQIRDLTLAQLRKAKPDLPLLEELAGLLKQHPGVGLLLGLKDLLPSGPNPGIVTHPAPYSGVLPAASGHVPGPENGKKPLSDDALREVDKGAVRCDERQFSLECACKALEILKKEGLNRRTWVLSFCGSLLEEVYHRYGKEFHYHAFYPWFIMGDMELDPADFCEMACMQHRFLDREGRIIRYEDPMCPESWWKEVLDFGMIPIAAPSLKTFENFDEAVRRGCRMINANDPKLMKEHFKL